MDDAPLVRGGETVRNLDCTVDRLTHAEPADLLAQRLALEQLGDDVGRTVVGANVEDRQDVRVIERRGSARFLFEAREPLGIG